MAQLFKPRANALAVVLLSGGLFAVIAIFGIVVAVASSRYATAEHDTPEQPVPFSHQHHAGELGIDCRYCHDTVEVSSSAGIPSTHTCMTCHSQIWTDAPMLAPERHSQRSDVPMHWNRVYDLADFVYFNHEVHVNNGVGCESCHGRVDRLPLMKQETPLTMQWCLGCHRNPAPNLRPESKITAMGYHNAVKPTGGELMKRYQIHPDTMTECYTCHR